MRLIDADHLIALVRDTTILGDGFKWAFIAIVDGEPAVQPEFLHCENCKYMRKYRSEQAAKKFGQIYECEKGVLNSPKENDYCSRAKRKPDEPD